MSWSDIFLTLGITAVFIGLSKLAGRLMPGNTWWSEEMERERERKRRSSQANEDLRRWINDE